jgi:hypothetical protein
LSSKPALGKQFLKPYLEKNPSQKVVEHLPSNCEALSSNPNTEKKKKGERRNEGERGREKNHLNLFSSTNSLFFLICATVALACQPQSKLNH